MKNNSKSALKIKQLIIIISILVIAGTNVQLFVLNKNNIDLANINKNEEEKQLNMDNTEVEIQVADNYEREETVTKRSSEERIPIEDVVVEDYLSIDEITISKNMDLTLRCGVSKEDFKELMNNLKADRSGFFYENSDTIYDACEKYELNEIFFCGLIAAESGWSISSNHRNTCNYISMMSGGKLIRYSTTQEGLEAAAKLLHNKYLTPGGSCYYGKTLSSVQKRFCPNSSTWVGLVYGCMNQIV